MIPKKSDRKSAVDPVYGAAERPLYRFRLSRPFPPNREFASHDAAILVLEQHHLDIVLMFSDIEMPGSRNGFALAQETAVRWPSVAIVVASGRLKPADGDLPTGACFIGKPFSAEMVHSHLREILSDDRKPEPLRQPS